MGDGYLGSYSEIKVNYANITQSAVQKHYKIVRYGDLVSEPSFDITDFTRLAGLSEENPYALYVWQPPHLRERNSNLLQPGERIEYSFGGVHLVAKEDTTMIGLLDEWYAHLPLAARNHAKQPSNVVLLRFYSKDGPRSVLKAHADNDRSETEHSRDGAILNCSIGGDRVLNFYSNRRDSSNGKACATIDVGHCRWTSMHTHPRDQSPQGFGPLHSVERVDPMENFLNVIMGKGMEMFEAALKEDVQVNEFCQAVRVILKSIRSRKDLQDVSDFSGFLMSDSKIVKMFRSEATRKSGEDFFNDNVPELENFARLTGSFRRLPVLKTDSVDPPKDSNMAQPPQEVKKQDQDNKEQKEHKRMEYAVRYPSGLLKILIDKGVSLIILDKHPWGPEPHQVWSHDRVLVAEGQDLKEFANKVREEVCDGKIVIVDNKLAGELRLTDSDLARKNKRVAVIGDQNSGCSTTSDIVLQSFECMAPRQLPVSGIFLISLTDRILVCQEEVTEHSRVERMRILPSKRFFLQTLTFAAGAKRSPHEQLSREMLDANPFSEWSWDEILPDVHNLSDEEAAQTVSEWARDNQLTDGSDSESDSDEDDVSMAGDPGGEIFLALGRNAQLHGFDRDVDIPEAVTRWRLEWSTSHKIDETAVVRMSYPENEESDEDDEDLQIPQRLEGRFFCWVTLPPGARPEPVPGVVVFEDSVTSFRDDEKGENFRLLRCHHPTRIGDWRDAGIQRMFGQATEDHFQMSSISKNTFLLRVRDISRVHVGGNDKVTMRDVFSGEIFDSSSQNDDNQAWIQTDGFGRVVTGADPPREERRFWVRIGTPGREFQAATLSSVRRACMQILARHPSLSGFEGCAEHARNGQLLGSNFLFSTNSRGFSRMVSNLPDLLCNMLCEPVRVTFSAAQPPPPKALDVTGMTVAVDLFEVEVEHSSLGLQDLVQLYNAEPRESEKWDRRAMFKKCEHPVIIGDERLTALWPSVRPTGSYPMLDGLSYIIVIPDHPRLEDGSVDINTTVSGKSSFKLCADRNFKFLFNNQTKSVIEIKNDDLKALVVRINGAKVLKDHWHRFPKDAPDNYIFDAEYKVYIPPRNGKGKGKGKGKGEGKGEEIVVEWAPAKSKEPQINIFGSSGLKVLACLSKEPWEPPGSPHN